MNRFRILEEIRQERIRQDKKWGWPQLAMYKPAHALAILAEEFGEVSKAVVEYLAYFPGTPEREEWRQEIRKELVQTAAVATSFIEHLDETNSKQDTT